MKKKQKNETELLVDQIIESILGKRGKELVSIDLRGIGTTVCDFFIICTGDSKTQVRAIAEGVEENIKKHLRVRPHHQEGLDHAQWVLIDYIDVIVHVFQKEYRDFYSLETLWADGTFKRIEDSPGLEKVYHERS